MSDILEKVKALKVQQDVLRDGEKKLHIDRVIYEGKLKEVTELLGFKEGEQIPLADIIERAMTLAVAK